MHLTRSPTTTQTGADGPRTPVRNRHCATTTTYFCRSCRALTNSLCRTARGNSFGPVGTASRGGGTPRRSRRRNNGGSATNCGRECGTATAGQRFKRYHFSAETIMRSRPATTSRSSHSKTTATHPTSAKSGANSGLLRATRSSCNTTATGNNFCGFT